MGHGRPPKCKWNISGLNNHSNPVSEAPRNSPVVEDPEVVVDPDESSDTSVNKEEDLAQCWIDDDQTGFAHWFGYLEPDIDEMSEEECEVESWEDNWFDDEDMQEMLYKYALAMDKDITDEDWVPEAVKARKKQRHQREQKCTCCVLCILLNSTVETAQPKEYAKAPDLAKKASRTQHRYRAAMKTQNSLKRFGFVGDAPVTRGLLAASNSPSPSISSTSEPTLSTSSASSSQDPFDVDVPVRVESEEPILNWETNRHENNNVDGDPITIHQESIEPELHWDDPAVFVGSAADSVNEKTQADLSGEA